MKYPFLSNNQLMLVDYLPGSSGQLLLRLWSELDSRLMYENDRIISDTSIEKHPSTREIEYDILIPKRITNWFLNECEPTSIEDHLAYFEFLGTCLVALTQKWKRGEKGPKFYPDESYTLVGNRRLYGIHTWDKMIPFREMNAGGHDIRCVSIVPKTERGLLYQSSRCNLCYPRDADSWRNDINDFNSKSCMQSFDLCTMLVDGDTNGIVSWLRQNLGADFREDKVSRVEEILDTYYREIVSPMGVGDV